MGDLKENEWKKSITMYDIVIFVKIGIYIFIEIGNMPEESNEHRSGL